MIAFTAMLTALFFKWGMLASQCHYWLGWMTLNGHIILRHYEYGAMFHFAQPLIHWTPF